MKTRLLSKLLTAICILMLVAACGGGHKGGGKASTQVKEGEKPWPDTLRVATLYSPGSYFIYRETEMGYDYELVNRLGEDKEIAIAITVAPNLSRAIEMLDSGKVDLIAYEVPVTAEYQRNVAYCGPENITSQVLVQPANAKQKITDVTQLRGRDVYVEKDSKYQHRLMNLSDEIGGGIIIHPIDRKDIITEDLIELVSRDSIPLTVVDSDIARLNRTYYPNLDVSLEVSFAQRSRWAVAPKNQWLADSIDSWLGQETPRRIQADILKRYFEESKGTAPHLSYNFVGGRVSPYDDLFKQYASVAECDWRLLAAIAYVESRFDNSVVSWAGARGMMQIMPSTARAYGFSETEMLDNSKAVLTAAKILHSLNELFKPYVKDSEERQKFVVAAYNSGQAHILDGIALAKKYGLNPSLWYANVEQAVLMKSKPEFYNDPVVKYGYFRARETVEFVKAVYSFYDSACSVKKK